MMRFLRGRRAGDKESVRIQISALLTRFHAQTFVNATSPRSDFCRRRAVKEKQQAGFTAA